MFRPALQPAGLTDRQTDTRVLRVTPDQLLMRRLRLRGGHPRDRPSQSLSHKDSPWRLIGVDHNQVCPASEGYCPPSLSPVQCLRRQSVRACCVLRPLKVTQSRQVRAVFLKMRGQNGLATRRFPGWGTADAEMKGPLCCESDPVKGFLF